MTAEIANTVFPIIVIVALCVDHTRGVRKAKDETIAIQKETISFLEGQVNHLQAKIHSLTKSK